MNNALTLNPDAANNNSRTVENPRVRNFGD